MNPRQSIRSRLQLHVSSGEEQTVDPVGVIARIDEAARAIPAIYLPAPLELRRVPLHRHPAKLAA